MRVFILACLVAAATALAPLHQVRDRIPGSYLIGLKPNANLKAATFNINTVRAKVTRQFEAFNMLAVNMDSSVVDKVRALSDVLFIEEDAIMHVQDATWGLDRVDQRALPLDNVYSPNGDGTGVNIYIIDTGVSPDHVDFAGRAAVAYDAVGNIGVDCNGHGTHCSGTTSGATWGVAKNSNVFGIRTLGCLGSGSISGIVDGMNWVAQNGARPAVASMSLGGGASTALDAAVTALHNAGVVVSVAAGNSNANACNYSPARAPEAITVGATDVRDSRASFSNYGACVDIFAPGVDITSAWIGDNDAINTISGTSMACPHVSGAAALYLQADPSMSPDAVWQQMSADSTSGVVVNPGFRSPNVFLYVPSA